MENTSSILMPWVSVFIPTRNEERHIARSIASAQQLTPHIYVVDGESTDDTVTIAAALGATVLSAVCENFAAKINWSLENIDFPTPWVMRLDADEMLTERLLTALPGIVVQLDPTVTGIYLRRQLWFMGQWIRYGGMYPTYTMRLCRKGVARCESRAIDEHILLSQGVAATVDLDIVDNPLITMNAWIEKHNWYAANEALEYISADGDAEMDLLAPRLFGNRVERMRWLKLKVFNRIPLFVRPWLYFIYRYLFRLGFLDGRKGFIFHFMHGLWYRMLVDAKVFESKYIRNMR